MSRAKQHSSAKRPDPQDFEVGRLIRAQRLICRMSQTELANSLGVTFQQVQKYEKGVSRVGDGRLARIADTLGVPISFFFESAAGLTHQRRVRPLTRPRDEDLVIKGPGVELRIAIKLSPAANTFLQRSMRAMLRIAEAETEDKLSEVMAAPTDVGMVARAISDTEIVGAAVSELDPLASLIAKGAEDKQKLIHEAGGLLSVGEVAEARGVTPQAIYKQRRARKLLAVPYGGEEKFPAAQFTAEGEPVPGLSAVLGAIDLAGPWGTLDFLLSPDDELDGLSPIETLKRHPEKLKEVVRLASTQAEHGAG